MATKRLYINNLPNNTANADLEKEFSKYGTVKSVEVRDRKNLTSDQQTQQFAFVNVEINATALDKCLRQFSNEKWKGFYLDVQIAKESFMERLKREREEAAAAAANDRKDKIHEEIVQEPIIVRKEIKEKYIEKPISIKSKVINEKVALEPIVIRSKEKTVEKPIAIALNEAIKIENNDLVKIYEGITVKNNKFKERKNGIESVANPLSIISKNEKKKSKDPARQKADEKRMKSMINSQKNYQQQKNLIRNALTNIDDKPKNKIIFDNENENDIKIENENENEKKRQLFNDDDDEEAEDDNKMNFEVKKQFEGKKGRKLLELQSKYKKDKRFELDERFQDEEEDDDSNTINEEKEAEFNILEEITGKKLMKSEDTKLKHKELLRFDPTAADHTKYELNEKKDEKAKKKNKKREKEKEIVVSNEKFYHVADNIEMKSTNESFSLRGMFQNNAAAADDDDEINEEEDDEININEFYKVDNVKKCEIIENNFKCDSSDDDKEENIADNESAPSHMRLIKKGIYIESLFFHKDDERLKIGKEFLRKPAEDNMKEEFEKIRKDVKYVINRKLAHTEKIMSKTRKEFYHVKGGFPTKRVKTHLNN